MLFKLDLRRTGRYTSLTNQLPNLSLKKIYLLAVLWRSGLKNCAMQFDINILRKQQGWPGRVTVS